LLINALFGEAWLPAAPILAILAWGGLIFPLHVLNLQIILAQGRPRTYFRVEILKKLVGVACVIVGSFFGIIGLAYAQLVVAILALFVNVEPVRRSLGYGVVRQLGDCGGTILVTAVMAGAILLLRPLLHFAPGVNLAILVVAGAAIYAGIGLAFRVRSFVEAGRVAKILLRGGRATDALA
jgi:O-antigen/teichoic acid export membrane protein